MGSIAKRRGEWRARYRDADGKEHSKQFRLKKDAKTWLILMGSPDYVPRQQPFEPEEPWEMPEPAYKVLKPPPPPKPPRPETVSLYRFYDAEGILLYVGITNDIPSRFDSHWRDKDWWPRVRSAGIEHFPDRASAAVAEAQAVRAECPVFNVLLQRAAGGLRPQETAR